MKATVLALPATPVGQTPALESQTLSMQPWNDGPNSPIASMFPPESTLGERRERDRVPYHELQWVAPYDGGPLLPDRKRFRQVRCCDISRQGIAFYTSDAPLDDFMVIALRTRAETVYIKARVAHSSQIGRGQQCKFKVGCEFVARIDDPA